MTIPFSLRDIPTRLVRTATDVRPYRGDRWRSTIIEQRDRLNKRLTKTPRLKKDLHATIAEAYADAVELAIKETELPRDTFPATFPYSHAEILDDGFFPRR